MNFTQQGPDDACVVVCAPNWLGDSIMAMPALQALRRHAPRQRIVMIAKPPLISLWRMHAAPEHILELLPGAAGVWQAAQEVRTRRAAAAYVLPNSIRAALVPLLAGVRGRIGQRGQRPGGMLTRVVSPGLDASRTHQAWEYMAILGTDGDAALEQPRLQVPVEAAAAMQARLGTAGAGPLIGVLPGAAYGPAKRWPARHFAAAAQRVAKQAQGRMVLLGGRAEAETCAEVAGAVGGALNLAGATSLPELAAVLARCAVVLCNDSGGMHLAAAVGTPVVAVYGITDPGKTGPLGEGHRVVFTPGLRRSRDLDRDSAAARAALAAIAPERVAEEALAVLKRWQA